MSCLNPNKRERLQARIDQKETQLAIANTTYQKLLAEDIEEYRFDSNEGAQRARQVKLSEMRNAIEALEAEIDLLYRRLDCGGVTTMSLRRKQYGSLYY